MALYVGIREDGDVEHRSSTSVEAFEEEFTRAKAVIKFAEDVDSKCRFSNHEYALFAEIFKTMFEDLASEPEDGISGEELFPRCIPAIMFVRKPITVASVVQPISSQKINPESSARLKEEVKPHPDFISGS